ncbi:MAG: acetyl-CoA carboxylase biotin carboxyl carrier protein [Thermodesulfovibrionales bacterium]
MELDDIKELIKLLQDTDVTEIELENEGSRIKVKRGKQVTVEATAARPQAAAPGGPEAAPEGEETQRLVTVTAPLVGTFYRASSPEAPPFVEVGDRVKKGQVLCIIEAMKLMNEIESEVDGVLVRALVENAQAVEYGEPLFLIEPV